MLHDKADRGATRTAAKAVVGVARGADVEGGALLVVKRAQADEIRPRLPQLHGTSHQRHDVRGGNHLLDGFFRNARHFREGVERAGARNW